VLRLCEVDRPTERSGVELDISHGRCYPKCRDRRERHGGEQGRSRSTLSKMERPKGATFWITGYYTKYLAYFRYTTKNKKKQLDIPMSLSHKYVAPHTDQEL